MNLYESFVIAFSMYSRIPMPKVEWSEKGMKYAMCFFPFVGIVLGLLMYACLWFLSWISASQLTRAVVLTVLPVMLTGGIHVDGWIDTSDALQSWQTTERKLEILKDPHVGAFGVIRCVVYFLITLAVMGEMNQAMMALYLGGLFLSRTLSGLSVVWFPCAKNSGLAATFADGAAKRKVRAVFLLYLAAAFVYQAVMGKGSGCFLVLGAVLSFWYYHQMSRKQFGGITGDLAGYFLCVCEMVMGICLVIAHYGGWI